MQKNYPKKRTLNKLKASLLLLMMVCFALPVKAQTRADEIRMKTGTETISDNVVYNFYDTGGPYIMDPSLDPNNDYNWVTWYQHNESYLLHFINPKAGEGKGIMLTFNYLLINNDRLKIYEGDLENEANLIADLTCNDYSTNNFAGYTVMSHGNMTLRFESDYHWRDAGWHALVKLFDYSAQPPVANMQACASYVELIPGSKAIGSNVQTKMYYTTDGTIPYPEDADDPLASTQLYNGPFEITVAPITVKTILVEGEGTSAITSSVATYTFSRLITPPGAPTITRVPNTNTVIITAPAVPTDINDTYYVRYTTDNTNPTAGTESVKGDTITLTTPCTVRAVTRGTTCPDIFSLEATPLVVTTIYVPTPVIMVTGTESGSGSITCSLPNATIYYTIDGTVPTTNSSSNSSTTAYDVDLSWGKSGSGETFDGVLTYSYVNASGQTVTSGNLTSEGDITVTVKAGSTITLTAKRTGGQDTYSITAEYAGGLIARATSANTNTTNTATGGPNAVMLSGIAPGTTIKAMAHVENNAYQDSPVATFLFVPTNASGEPQNGVYGSVVLLDDREDHGWSYYSDPNSPVRSLNPADVKISYFGYGNGTMTTTDNNNTPTTFAGNVTGNQVAVSASESANQFVYLQTLERKGGDVATSLEASTGRCLYTTIANPFTKRPTYGTDDTRWRGFYAWRVKAVRGGSIYTTATGGTALATNAIVNADTQLYFAPNAETGMEVEFEALWARAYVTNATTNGANNVGNYTVGYERNFLVLATNNAYYMGANAGNNRRITNTNNRDVTITSTYPDGSTPNNRGQFRVYGTLTLGYNMKIENVTINAYGQYGDLDANGFYLHIGRGLNTNNNLCYRLIGSSGSEKDHNFTIRAESGLIRSVYLTNGGVPNNYRFHCNLIFGSDYDRAKNDNAKLLVAPDEQIVFGQGMISGNVNKDKPTLDCVLKSGTFQSGYQNTTGEQGQNTHSIYIGSTNGHNETGYAGKRYITVEGGEIANIAGGRGPMEEDYAPAVTDTVVTVRIKGGRVHGSVYGGASSSTSYGSRKIVITGGEVQGWVATGCNSTSTGYGGVTSGTGNIYIGGNAVIGGSTPRTINGTAGGNVFGAGHGKDLENAASMSATCVVIADNADILHNVYGGGNYGYVYPTGQDAYDGEHKADLYILGGTVHENVFGGANMNEGQHVYITMNGGEVQGSVYGGSNTYGKIHEDASITMNGGLVKGSVFGGGYGGTYDGNHDYDGTVMAKNTSVTVNGGTINGNVYGGGALGVVDGNTNVTVAGGTVNNVFGAGMGRAASTGVTALTANIGGTTTVTVKNNNNVQPVVVPTIAESVYGGGENGNVKQATNPTGSKDGEEGGDRDITAVSTVNITGGNIGLNVFGGGKMGYTNGGTVVNMSGGSVEGSVFGGAFGTNGKVYVAGQRTVNLRGGTINKHVYGGSRNADDALVFNPGSFNGNPEQQVPASTEARTASVVNMSGGYVHYQVFASGYFGNVFGSTYAFIGTNAILNAPNHVAPSGDYNADFYNAHQALRIGGSVWAGGDFGNYDGSKFGDPTISGYSHVYIDGDGYDTESNNTTNTNYMSIGGSIYGSGTSCDAGKQGRDIILRNYGKMINASQPTAAKPYSSATRALYSIQRATNLTIDNAHVVLLGEGKINSLVTTEKYTIHEFRLVRLTNGSSIFLNFPADQIMKFGSYTCEDVYDTTSEYVPVQYNGLGAQGGSTDNKILVNDGAYINIYHDELTYTVNGQTQKGGFGELEGYAHMMSDNTNHTCAYARPKQSKDDGNQINSTDDNPLDGGFISYDSNNNTFTLGTLSAQNTFNPITNAPGMAGESETGVQMAYENHTVTNKNGEQYFRIWRAGGTFSYREGVFVAQGDGTDSYSTVDVVVSLPAFENCESGTGYYRIKSLEGNTTIDQGTDVMLVNAACYSDVDEADWMFFSDTINGFRTGKTQAQCSNLHYISEQPNVNFGLVAIPSGGLQGNDDMLICEASDEKIATMQWANLDNSSMPKVTFRLTYNKNLTNNVVWDPMTITFEQYNCSGQLAATVDVALTVTTLTSIDQPFKTQAYAIVRGSGSATDSYIAKIVLPQYVMHVNTVGEISKWTCKNVEFHPEDGFSQSNFVGGTSYLNNVTTPCNDKFGMTLEAGYNFDNTIGWESWETRSMDMHGWNNPNYVFGETTARDPIAFDFTLLYDGHQKADRNYKVGTLEFTMHFTNYEGAEHGDPAYEKDLTIEIEIWFLGQGNNYYIDGVHGNNLYSGRYPNAAKKTLSGVFNRTDYVAGDNIFIVDAVTADGNNKLTWNGKAYNEVTLYRYPGGHQCVDPDAPKPESHWAGYDVEGNATYRGPLVKVAKNMDMTGIVLNGFYEESKKPVGEAAGDIVTPAGDQYYHQYVDPSAPLIQILDGGTLSMYGASRAEFNYNSETDGGGIYVANGGVLNLYNGSAVETNYVSSGKNGGGIYVNSTSKVQLSDLVFVTGNHKGIPSAKADESVENNVYLSTYDSWVDVGTAETDDPYTQLLPESRVGITKNNDWGDYWYAPVAYSDGGQGYLRNTLTENIPTTGAIMWDDQTKYEILSLNNTHLNPPTDYVYFVGTWVTEVTENPQHPDQPNNFDLTQIDTPYELAWLISYVNGLNGASKHPEAVATLTGDIDMSANIWVPITNYTGTFNGNGHVVTGLRSPLNQEHMGMFGYTNNAHISDLVAQSNFSGGSMINVGTVIGTMNGGTLTNVEAAGTLTGTNLTENMGGLVGKTTKVGEVSTPAIHSAFAVNTISGGNNTIIGGLVGTNGGDLYNSYANVTLGTNNTATTLGGLVGVNSGHVENCYVINPIGPAFAGTNNGTINICYAADGTDNFVGSGSDQGDDCGTYGEVFDRKAIGYMYADNAVSATNDYVASEITYTDVVEGEEVNVGHITKWPGLLSTLNQWVDAHSGYTSWFRPTSGDINGDLPVLGFTKDNSLATEDGKFLYYGSNVNANGLDNLFTVYDGKTANMFLYGNATDVTLGNGSNPLFINEDAVLLQKATDGNTPDITATVGVTFDNSCGDGTATNTGAPLTYDWHFMSTPLQNAPINATYGATTGFMNPANIESMDANCYFPNGLFGQNAVTWDFYTYSEEFHHWVNLKRTDHFYQENGQSFDYDNETSFEKGKGYMMAISQDSYMSSTGLLNNDDVEVTLTNKESEHLDTEYNEGWNLVGNPYQGYLDLEALFDADVNPNASQAYVYDADLKAFTPFVNGASENPTIIERYLHQHQAFFVHAEPDENEQTATLTFMPNMATAEIATGYTAPYYRGEGRINYPLVNLFAENTKGNRDLAVIEFNRPELGGATKVNGVRNANFQVAASLEGHRYGLVFTPEGTEKVPVHFTTEENGTFTLTWETLHGDFTSLLLVDNMTGTITDMLRADSYTFDATTDDYASRFYITYTVTGVDENNEGDGTFAFFDGSEWVVNGKGQLDVVDVQGRTLYSERLVNDKNRVSLNGVAAGVYLLRVSDGTNTMVQKIVVK